MISNNFIFIFTNFCIIVIFCIKLLTLSISFSTAVKAVVVAKLVISGILFLASTILEITAVVDEVVDFIYFRIKSSISGYVSSIRCFIFNIFDLCIIYIFFNNIFFY